MKVTGHPDLRIEDLRELFGDARIFIQSALNTLDKVTISLYHRDNMMHRHWTFDRQRADKDPIATVIFTKADIHKSPYDYANMLMGEVWKREFPVSAKLKEIQDQSQKCGEFIDWMKQRGMRFGEFHEHTDECYDAELCGVKDTHKKGPYCQRTGETFVPVFVNTQNLLAEFFGIDQVALEAEKERMLEEIRT
jgi:hypothetical protein